MASVEIETARLEALNARRNEGADAWSPSRAREAVRRMMHQNRFRLSRGDVEAGLREIESVIGSRETMADWIIALAPGLNISALDSL